MQGSRFDDLTRTFERAAAERRTRRAVLRALAAAGSAAVVTGERHSVLAQDAAATPAAIGQVGTRPPGGPTVKQKAYDLFYDPKAVFEFVAKEVAYDPYPGALRGSAGTIWGLAGNSVDQAQLLAALLNESQVRTRFAIGTLDESTAGKLLTAAQLSRDDAETHAQAVNTLLTEEQGAPPQQPLSAELQALVDKSPERSTALVQQSSAQLTGSVDQIQQALTAAGVSVASPGQALPDRERTQHVWVQYADGPDWRDLDPAIPGAEMDTPYATIVQTVDELPDELFHTVSYRLYAEKVQSGQAVQAEMIAYSARSIDLVEKPISVQHVKPEALRALGASIDGSLEGTLQYIPHLLLGSEEAQPATDRVTLGTGGGLLDVLGGGGSNDGDTVAEWLEITVASPDAGPKVTTRTVFDRLTPEQRAAGTFDYSGLAPVELAEFKGDKIFLPVEAMWTIATATGPIPYSYFQQDSSIDDFSADLASMSHQFHNARDIMALQVAANYGHRFYFDAPNLTAFSITALAIDQTSGRARVEIDLIHQAIAAAPFSDSSEQTTVAPGVVAGVLSHVTERLLMEQRIDGIDLPRVSSTSVGRVFDEAAKQGVTIHTLQPGTSFDPGAHISVRAKTGIEAALAAGYAVVVPERAVDLDGQQLVGWWRIDPNTGATIDQMEDGHGASMSEYALMLQTIVRNALYYYGELGLCVYAAYVVAALVLFDIGVFGGAINAQNNGGLGPGGLVILAGATGVNGGVAGAISAIC